MTSVSIFVPTFGPSGSRPSGRSSKPLGAIARLRSARYVVSHQDLHSRPGTGRPRSSLRSGSSASRGRDSRIEIALLMSGRRDGDGHARRLPRGPPAARVPLARIAAAENVGRHACVSAQDQHSGLRLPRRQAEGAVPSSLGRRGWSSSEVGTSSAPARLAKSPPEQHPRCRH